jgi:hypothetical protein
MNSKFVAALVVVLFEGCLWAQTPDNPEQLGTTAPPAAASEGSGIIRAELGGFSNFVNNGSGTWDGLSGRFTFLGQNVSPRASSLRPRRDPMALNPPLAWIPTFPSTNGSTWSEVLGEARKVPQSFSRHYSTGLQG